jgi:CheY-like chemotaxis protein
MSINHVESVAEASSEALKRKVKGISRVLVAEDDRVSKAILKLNLEKSGYEVVVRADGLQAWSELQKPEAPRMAILAWMMPGMDGIHVCQAVRKSQPAKACIFRQRIIDGGLEPPGGQPTRRSTRPRLRADTVFKRPVA